MSQKIADQIDGLEFFRDFSYPELEALGRYLGTMTVDQGKLIFDEGDPGNSMLILIDGRISIFKTGSTGRHLLSYEGRGRIVGEMALLDQETRSARCVADSRCEFLTLDRAGLERLASEHPLLAYRFMYCLARQLSKRLRRTSGVLADYLEN